MYSLDPYGTYKTVKEGRQERQRLFLRIKGLVPMDFIFMVLSVLNIQP